jgi:hypothetical protein
VAAAGVPDHKDKFKDAFKDKFKDTYKDTSGGVVGSTNGKAGSNSGGGGGGGGGRGGGGGGGGGLFGNGGHGDDDPLGVGLLLGARTGINSGKSSLWAQEVLKSQSPSIISCVKSLYNDF